jgi:hypothetical protein
MLSTDCYIAGFFRDYVYYNIEHHITGNIKQTPWALVRKLYRLSDRHLLAKFNANICGVQRGESPTVVNLSFLDRSRYFSFK